MYVLACAQHVTYYYSLEDTECYYEYRCCNYYCTYLCPVYVCDGDWCVSLCHDSTVAQKVQVFCQVSPVQFREANVSHSVLCLDTCQAIDSSDCARRVASTRTGGKRIS
eukprot:6212981-Pleurochrysis_carterae.AAC.9